MIAHPERNKAVMKDLKNLQPFVEQECLFQLTAGSVAGIFGKAAQKRAQQILKRGWCSVLASDAHNIMYRPPDLTAGLKAASLIVGESRAWDMVKNTPLKIVHEQFEHHPA